MGWDNKKTIWTKFLKFRSCGDGEAAQHVIPRMDKQETGTQSDHKEGSDLPTGLLQSRMAEVSGSPKTERAINVNITTRICPVHLKDEGKVELINEG